MRLHAWRLRGASLANVLNVSNVTLTCPDKSLNIKSYRPLVNAKYLTEWYMKRSTSESFYSDEDDFEYLLAR